MCNVCSCIYTYLKCVLHTWSLSYGSTDFFFSVQSVTVILLKKLFEPLKQHAKYRHRSLVAGCGTGE